MIKNYQDSDCGCCFIAFKCNTILLCLIGIVASHVHAAEIDSLSSELLEQVGEDAYWQATVACEGSAIRVAIRQKLKQEEWCTKTELLPCEESKIAMAAQVCSNLGVFVAAESGDSTTDSMRSDRPNVDRDATAERESSAKRAAEARLKAEQQAKESQQVAEASAALKAEELELQTERDKLEQEKMSVQQAELELSAKEREVKAQLKALEN